METANSETPLTAAQIVEQNALIVREADKLAPILKDAAHADKQTIKYRNGISNALIAIAVECGNREVFTLAMDKAEARYKVANKAKGIKRLPKIWTQAKSDVKAMFDRNVPLTDTNGAPVSYSVASKALNEARKKAAKTAEKEAADSVPEHLKQFRAVAEIVIGTQDEAFISEVSKTIAEMVKEYRVIHPEQTEADDSEIDDVRIARVG